jgi:hypothetical protein
VVERPRPQCPQADEGWADAPERRRAPTSQMALGGSEPRRRCRMVRRTEGPRRSGPRVRGVPAREVRRSARSVFRASAGVGVDEFARARKPRGSFARRDQRPWGLVPVTAMAIRSVIGCAGRPRCRSSRHLACRAPARGARTDRARNRCTARVLGVDTAALARDGTLRPSQLPLLEPRLRGAAVSGSGCLGRPPQSLQLRR